MPQTKRNLFIIFICLLLSFGCKNNNTWLGRTWHNMASHYNAYFNADQDWQSTVLLMREGYKDDYRNYLELYNYGSNDALKGNQGVMDGILKKLSTIIDKHPKSKWVDDCYFLMGRAYFMKGDFFAASDIFEYVNSNFKDPLITFEAKLWIFKCLYFQGKNGQAEDLIVALKNDPNFPKKLLAPLNMALGAIYLHNNKPKPAAEHLELCLTGKNSKLDRIRLHYALGQCYQNMKEWDKAAAHFAKVVRMNPPYEMAFNSEVNRVEILSQQKQNYDKANRILRNMLKDDKNIEYYSQIYYRMGLNELRSKNDLKAIGYFNQSLMNGKSDRAQSTTTYLTLGDYFFENKVYEKAGLYYDSANNLLDEKHPNYEQIAKRGTILGELLKNLILIKHQDSLLSLGRDPVLREKTIDRLMNDEKKRAANARNNPTPSSPVVNTSMNPDPSSFAPSSFPFYNVTNRNRGIEEFQKNWGKRENRDYWRINSKKSTAEVSSNNPNISIDSIGKVDSFPLSASEDRKKYYKEIPLTKSSQAEAEKKIEDAIYAAAGVYQNSLDAPKDAINMYKILLKRYPNTQYEAKVLYEIAKLSKAAGEMSEFDTYKKLLEQKHPESIYLRLLNDPNAKIDPEKNGVKTDRKEIEDLYYKMYNAYKTEQFELAIKTKQESDQKFAGNALQPQFDYLYALCLIKSNQLERGIAALGQVASDYSGTEIAVRAQSTIDAYKRRLLPEVKDTSSTSGLDSAAGSLWKQWDGTEELFFILTYRKGANSNLIRAGLNDFNKTNFVFENLEVSPTRAFGESVYLTISNYSKPMAAKEYLTFIESKPDFFASKGLFEYDIAWISKTNYSLLVTNNRINSYVDYFKTVLK